MSPLGRPAGRMDGARAGGTALPQAAREDCDGTGRLRPTFGMVGYHGVCLACRTTRQGAGSIP